MDRLICQAIAQVLTPVFEPHFHPHSFGFRPERSAHQAVERARQFIADGAEATEEGTPQDSPLSPLLSNVMLDDLDWELDRRGHRFVRYADDVRIYVRSERAGQRVMESIAQFVERRLKLRVNRYFAVADTPYPFEQLDEWLRRRLRQVRWKEWKRYRTRRRNLRALGIPEREAREWAGSRKGYWRLARSWVLPRALPNAYWRDLGFQGFADPYRRFRDATRTAGCGPTRPVVW